MRFTYQLQYRFLTGSQTPIFFPTFLSRIIKALLMAFLALKILFAHILL